MKLGLCIAKRKAQEEKFNQVKSNSSKNSILKVTKKIKRENQNIVGGKSVKNDAVCLSCNVAAKQKARKSHYQKLLNVEFGWVSGSLPEL